MTVNKVHWSFWVISVFLLIWNAMGTVNFLWQINANSAVLATLPETHRAIIEGRPLWATGGFAVGVVAGACGCFLLLFKKFASFYLFLISLIGIVLTMVHTVIIAITVIGFSLFEIIVMIIMPLAVAIFLIWYTLKSDKMGWIN